MLNTIGATEDVEPRYNGGWTKQVTSLDKTVTTGYSILGDFVTVGDFKEFYDDGLYLDCDIQGSRKHQDKNYTLIRIHDGEGEKLHQVLEGGRDWATEFWDPIEKELSIDGHDTCDDDIHELVERLISAAGSKEKAIEQIERA